MAPWGSRAWIGRLRGRWVTADALRVTASSGGGRSSGAPGLPRRTPASSVQLLLCCTKERGRRHQGCVQTRESEGKEREGLGWPGFTGIRRRRRRNGGAPVSNMGGLGALFEEEEEGNGGGDRGL